MKSGEIWIAKNNVLDSHFPNMFETSGQTQGLFRSTHPLPYLPLR